MASVVYGRDKVDAVENSFNKSRWIPFVYYTPETSLATGIFLLKNLGKKDVPRISQLRSAALVTTQKQVYADVILNSYFNEGQSQVKTKVYASIFPQYYYGQGNETQKSDQEEYNETYHGVEFETRRLWVDVIYGGLKLDYDSREITDSDERITDLGFLDKELNISELGFGPYLVYDSRDSELSPEVGTYLEFSHRSRFSVGGQSYSYRQWDVDARTYLPLFAQSTVALQLGFGEQEGDFIPFQKLLRLGGRNILRGIYKGRYRDQSRAFFQAEYRSELTESWKYALFGGLGRVAPRLRDLGEEDDRYSLGFGVRYVINQESKTRIRIDFGIAGDQSGFYFVFDEAY